LVHFLLSLNFLKLLNSSSNSHLQKRGEWFDLTSDDLNGIIADLDYQKTIFQPENQSKIQF